ncbi:MAG: hypothetical protein EOO51_06445 [Flavobacterium sp.]|nr:MAG: hypothetical protein EOO51_06445 [Flavobacterium sp.]
MAKYDQPSIAAFGAPNQKLKLGSRFEVEAYILIDRSYIIEQNSLQAAFNLTEDFGSFFDHINSLTALPIEFLEEIKSPHAFEITSASGNSSKLGYSPQLITEGSTYIKKCNQLGLLFQSEIKYARAAEIWLRSSEEIDEKIRFYSGFHRYRQNIKERFTAFCVESTGNAQYNYILTIPDQFWSVILPFYGLEFENLTTKPIAIAEILQHIIFDRLLENALQLLKNTKPKMKYRRKEEIEKYLPTPELQNHFAIITSLINAAKGSQTIFNQLLENTLPGTSTGITTWQHDTKPENSLSSARLNNLNQQLKIAVETQPIKKS